MRDEERLLREAGHDVASWTPAPGPELSRARLGSRTLWSTAAVGHVRHLIDRHRPQILHCHNLFPMLSPAVLRAARDRDSRVVVTLHNYRMFCLPATCVRDGEICELCLGRVPWRGVVYRCYRGSLAGSTAMAASLSLHRAIGSFDRRHHVPACEPLRARQTCAGRPDLGPDGRQAELLLASASAVGRGRVLPLRGEARAGEGRRERYSRRGGRSARP